MRGYPHFSDLIPIILAKIYIFPAKQMVSCDSTVKEISFEWSHHMGFRPQTQKLELNYLYVSISDSGSVRVDDW